jgi:tetratricopeptide (TPR) repeat protein
MTLPTQFWPHRIGEPQSEELETYRALLKAEPDSPALLAGTGASLRAANLFGDALECLTRAVELDPCSTVWMCQLGQLYEELGDFPKAIAQFRRVLSQRSDHPGAIAHLLELREGTADSSLVSRAESYLSNTSTAPASVVQIHFALGKHWDNSREFDRAFRHCQEANALLAAERPYEAATVETRTTSWISAYDRSTWSLRRTRGSDSERPVFIVGMPRSGTTLTEQILASHRQVASAGELSYFDRLHLRLTQELSLSRIPVGYVRQINDETLSHFAVGYLEILSAVSKDASRVVDKMPTNFWYLGLIAMTFPKARIIHCSRDPLDTCLSCYSQNFYENQGYRVNLESLGHYYGQYRRLMEHWMSTLDSPILEVRYEDTVLDLEGQARRLIEFCGLEWDPNCLSFHTTSRGVKSPSRWQVRQPIYSTSIARWRGYDRHLAPLRQALARNGSLGRNHL